MAKLTLLLVVSALVVVMASAAPSLDLFDFGKKLLKFKDDKDDFDKDFEDMDKDFDKGFDSIKTPTDDEIKNMKPDKDGHVDAHITRSHHSTKMVDGKVVENSDSCDDIANKDGKVTEHHTGSH